MSVQSLLKFASALVGNAFSDLLSPSTHDCCFFSKGSTLIFSAFLLSLINSVTVSVRLIEINFNIQPLPEQFAEDVNSSCWLKSSCDSNQSSLASRGIHKTIALLFVVSGSQWVTGCF